MSDLLRDHLVLELASVLAGPSVGQFLAEQGAAVLKVENVRTRGDVTRRWHLPSECPDDDRPAYFACCNAGKASVALDLGTADGRRLLHDLAARADVVLASYRPGAAARLGADAATLRAVNPGLVYASVSGYGPNDPRPGYDAVIQAESGFMAMNGAADGPPTKLPVALMDVLAAHQLKEAVLLALLRRARTGEGATLDVSLLQAAVSALANQAMNWLVGGHVPRRMGSAHPNIVPYGTPFPTADGRPVVPAVGTDRQFAALCDAAGCPELAADPRFATNAGRVAHRDALEPALAAALARCDRDALLAALAERRVPAGPVRDVREVFATEAARSLVLAAEPGDPAGLRQSAFRLDGATPRPLAPPPHYAADTAAALRAHLGLDDAALERLARAGVLEIRPD